ncbi:MAG: ribosomal-processing cysteine protease Prp [Acidaminococcaceae bacterium]
MITIELDKNEQGFMTAYKVSGHAEYNPDGMDIVCALVSVLTQVPIMGLEQHLKLKPFCHVNEEDGILEVRLAEAPTALTQAILATMECGVRNLAQEYQEYIRIQEHRR